MVNEITIKKSDLWKYSTFALILVVLVVAFFLFKSPSGTNNNGTDNGAGTVDLSPFLSNSDLYPSLGPKDAKNVVIEFSDFQCPWCAIASGLPSWALDAAAGNPQVASVLDSAKNVEEMAAQGKLRFIYVPMSFLDDRSATKESDWAVEAGYCANEQGKFWEMHDAIFTAQTQGENTGKYNKDKLEIIGQEIAGLDNAKFKTCLETSKYASSVQTAATQARTAATGTPTFYVNGESINPSWASIQSALK